MFHLSSALKCRQLGHTLSAFAAGLLLATTPAFATDFTVSNASEISNAMNSARPGDVLIMTDGVWTNQDIEFAGDGTASSPITLRAETPGGVQLNGTSRLSISGSHLVVDGLNFENGGDNSLDYVIEFRGSEGDASDCRLTNTQIRNYNPQSISTRYHWVNIYGQDNRVDHCRFQGQTHSGVTVVVVLNNNRQEARHQIDNNAFLDRPLGNGNGFEGIRVGTSARHTTSAQVLVENNLFENVDGEIEIISNKSADNIYRYNTFRSCAGTLTLRHGSRATVDGNFFLGEGKDRSGGIRVVDRDHVIVNNYIADVDDRADGAISLSAGIIDGPANGYQLVDNITIHNNTIVDVGGSAIIFDWGLGVSRNGGPQEVLPENVSVMNNLIRSSRTLFEGQEGPGYDWVDNIAFGASLGISSRSGLQTVDPRLELDGTGLWRPASNSPAINSGTTINSITDDIDGQPRTGAFDIGADEVSNSPITRQPLTANDVGPVWDTFNSPVEPPPANNNPTAIPVGSFVALQAENFAEATDPDGDGDTWEIVSDPSAHGELAIESPSGSRTDSSSQEAIALYNVSFSEAGTYTAYYRAFGTSGSSDSFFAPDAFNSNPTVSESTSNNGAYRWETGVAFTVSESSVGESLQLRIGRREGGNRIDAIVIHERDDLSPEELDVLFAEPDDEEELAPVFLLGDCNLDGEVNFFDISPFVSLLSTGDFLAEADCNQDTFVNFFDISPFIVLLIAP